MINDELVGYIKKQFEKNVSKETIVSRLVGVGWHLSDVEEALIKISEEKNVNTSSDNLKKDEPKIDPYHEPIGEEEKPIASFFKPEKPQEIKLEVEPEQVEQGKVWTPRALNPIAEQEFEKEDTYQQKEQPVVKPVSTSVEIFQKELNKPSGDLENIKQTIKEEKKIPLEQKPELEIPENIPTLIPKAVNIQPKIEEMKESVLVEDNTPHLIPKVENQFTIEKPEPIFIDPAQEVIPKKIPGPENNLSKQAMISSYSQDYMSANNLKQEVHKRKKGRVRVLLITFAIIVFVAGLIFTLFRFTNVSNLLNFDLNLIKKNPKVLLVDSLYNLNNLEYYKTETKTNVSFPSISNLTTSLISGETVSANDKDFISLVFENKFNRSDKTNTYSNHRLSLESSLLLENLNFEINKDSANSFVDISDLGLNIESNDQQTKIISIPNKDLSNLTILLPDNLKDQEAKFNWLRLIFGSLLSDNTETFLPLIDNLANSFEMVKKESETIYGVETNRYTVIVDSEMIQSFLTQISDVALANQDEQTRQNLKEVWSSSSINSFDIWLGKKDDNIYQYKINLSLPLSKIIGFSDKSLSNSEVILELETTYYDLGVQNDITLPAEATSFDDLSKKISDLNMKKMLVEFKSLVNDFYSITKNYGSKLNSSGSCTEPAPGSIFSPLGHSSNVLTTVGPIAESINSIVSSSHEAPICLSDSKSWVMATLSSSGIDTYLCVDNKTDSVVEVSAPTKTSCQ